MTVPVAQAAPNVAYSTLHHPADGYYIERDLGIVFGMAAGASYKITFNVAQALQDLTRNAEAVRNAAMQQMGNQAAARGANIVLGVTFETDPSGSGGIVTCCGTACIVRKRE